MRRALALALAILSATPAVAAPTLDPAPTSEEVELARRRYETGKWLYEHHRYAEALTEFRAAQVLTHRPQLDYNIGLCEEQLGHHNEAAEAYRRFVVARPEEAESLDVRGRIARLDAVVLASLPPRPPPRLHRGLSIGLGASGLVLGATGIALGSVVLARRHDAASYDQNRAMAISTDLLLPAGGALALAGLIVYLVDRRAQRRAR